MSKTIYGNKTQNNVFIDDMIDNNEDIHYLLNNEGYFARLSMCREMEDPNLSFQENPGHPAIAAFNEKNPYEAIYAVKLEGDFKDYFDENKYDTTELFDQKLESFKYEFDAFLKEKSLRNTDSTIMYSVPDKNGISHKKADCYFIELTNEESERCGAYYSDYTHGALEYIEYVNGDKELRVGCAEMDGYICSWTPLNNDEFTKNQADYACSIVTKVMKQKDSTFKLSESIIKDFKQNESSVKLTGDVAKFMNESESEIKDKQSQLGE